MQKIFLILTLTLLFVNGQSQNIYPASGNVGVGTTNPLNAIHVYGSNELNILVQNNAPGGARTYLTAFSDKSSIQTDKDFTIRTNYGGSWNDKFILTNSGNIGIGTTTPLNAVHIVGPNELNLLLQNSASGGARTYLTAFSDKSSIQTDKDFTIRTNYGGGWNDRFIVTNAGNVGIGTTTTGSFRLAVEGKIGAREINVTSVTPWPDYVFEKSYDLPTLEELSAYLKENKHLPEIPSAATVEDKGVDLGEMNTLLLKKIEELTIYVLELKKENEHQQSEIEHLKRRK